MRRGFSAFRGAKLSVPVILSLFSVIVLFIPDLALAGTTDNALSPAWTTVSNIMSGYGGKLISGVSFLCAIIGSVWGFNPRLIVGAGAVGITTALAPAFITATVGALI